ncbi:hypothetical protein [Oleiagrimonas sp.]|jgi:hypothetical protein|uniref:hypothetical protein n=1 Tax=Oleiagrimonas sp. TaxID=2010330 RepID=UPI00260774D8|nr:hypothetical protein [Oleiagrimonas sp.]MDA3913858.1 hypothetical protein [Oleiagrimonas sp.]
MTREAYKPVPADIETTRKRWSQDPIFKKAYDALADEFEAQAKLVRVRTQPD